MASSALSSEGFLYSSCLNAMASLLFLGRDSLYLYCKNNIHNANSIDRNVTICSDAGVFDHLATPANELTIHIVTISSSHIMVSPSRLSCLTFLSIILLIVVVFIANIYFFEAKACCHFQADSSVSEIASSAFHPSSLLA